MNHQDDASIIDEVRSGRVDAYEILIHRYQDRILGLCASLLAGTSDPDDAAQEVFIKAYHALDRFRSESSFSTWLHRIAVNHCRDILRRKAARPEESLEQIQEREGRAAPTLEAAGNPADRAENVDWVDRVLSHLPPDLREVLVLREVHGLTYEEIADCTGHSMDSIKARIRRARLILDEVLGRFRASAR